MGPRSDFIETNAYEFHDNIHNEGREWETGTTETDMKCWSDNSLRKRPPLERLEKKKNNIKMDLSNTIVHEANWNVLH